MLGRRAAALARDCASNGSEAQRNCRRFIESYSVYGFTISCHPNDPGPLDAADGQIARYVILVLPFLRDAGGLELYGGIGGGGPAIGAANRVVAIGTKG